MFGHKIRTIRLVLCVFCLTVVLLATASTENPEAKGDKIIERYKLMLERKPKEGSTFDRLYQLYLEGAGLEKLVADYQADTEAKPNNPNLQLILGHIFKRLGKHEEAIAVYQHAVGLAPNDFYPYFALGRAYAARRRHEDAISALTQAAELASTSHTASLDELITLYKTLGRAYFSRDRVEEAILAWGKIAEIDPRNVFARVELADLFREQELYTEAIEQHEAIIRLKNEDPYRVCLSYREIGKIQEEKGDYGNAIRSYDAAIALTAPGNWLRKDLQQRIVGVYAGGGDWGGLIAHYHTKLTAAPNDPELIGLLASAYVENQQLDEGIAAYRKGLQLSPTDAELRLSLIAVLRNSEKIAEAAAEYELLSEMQPDNFGIYRELGELYLELEDENRAKSAYQRMIDRAPKDAGTHLVLAEIYAGHKWIDDAIGAYEKVISLAPDNLDSVEYFGEFYLRQGDRAKTLETWNRMVAGDKESGENYDRLAQLLETKDFPDEAIAASRNAAKLAPGEYRYRKVLARRLMDNGEYDAALSEYAKASKLAPNEFFAEQINDQQIEIYRRQGVLGKQIEIAAGAPRTFNQQKQLAKMYLTLGNLTDAMESLKHAKMLKPDDVLLNRQLVALYTELGLRDEAVASCRHLVKIDAENAREYYTDIAQLQRRAMHFDAAVEAARHAINHSPRNPEGYQLLASIEQQRGHLTDAIDSLKRAVRLRSDATEIRAELAKVYQLAGEHQQAIEQYWRCWDLSEDLRGKLGFVRKLSNVYIDLGVSDALDDKLRNMNRATPNDPAPAIALAELYRMRGEFPAARAQLAMTLERESENPDLLSRLVEINRLLGDTQEAIAYQQQLVKVLPDQAHQLRLGELLFNAAREQEAIQVWTRVLHGRNQTVEAEIKLATLLSRHGLLNETRVALDRAGEKVQDPEKRYKIGALLAEINETESATQHFKAILAMPKPSKSPATNTGQTVADSTRLSQRSLLPDTRRFDLPKNLVRRIQRPNRTVVGQLWSPDSFEEAQAGALAQLALIAQRERRLDGFVVAYEAKAKLNPNDLAALETLVKIYILMENPDKTIEIINRLIMLSPNDPVFIAVQLEHALRRDLDYESASSYLHGLKQFSLEARLWYACELMSALHRQGRTEDAARLLSETEFTIEDLVSQIHAKITDARVVSRLMELLTQIGRIEMAEAILSQLVSGPTHATMGQQWRYQQTMYSTLLDAYVRNGQIGNAIDLFWKSLESSKPFVGSTGVPSIAYSPQGHGRSQLARFSFPGTSVYYDTDRLRFLKTFFLNLWAKNRLEPLYAKFQSEFEAAEAEDRIFRGLGLSYIYWWDGMHDQAQKILTELQAQFPDDLVLMLQTVFVFIHTGKHQEALTMLSDIADRDRQNRDRYDGLALEVAIYTGNTVKVRELLTRILNSTVNADSLLGVAENLQRSGFTQYAVAAAKGAMKLAQGRKDPNFLVRLSRQLEQVGRGQEAAILAERAVRFAHRRSRYGQAMHQWDFQQAVHLMRRRVTPTGETQLLAAVEKKPTSFQAQMRLAAHYEGTNEVDKAAQAFEVALSIRPKDETVRWRYAQMLMRGGRSDAAIAQFTILSKNNPNAFSSNYWEVIHQFFDAGKIDEIVALAKASIGPSLGHGSSHRFADGVAQRCLQNNLPGKAAEIYEELLTVNPNNIQMYNQLASAYAASGEREKAIQFLYTRLEVHESSISKDWNTLIKIIPQLIELSKGTDAMNALREEYEAELAASQDDLPLIYLVALMRLAAGGVAEAEPLVNRLLTELSTPNRDWFDKLAEAYRVAGNREGELRMLNHSIQNLNLGNQYWASKAYEKLGKAYAQGGDKERAKDNFGKMGTLRMMAFGSSSNSWEKREIADLYMQYEMWDDAETMYMQVLQDLSADQFFRQQARQQLIEIKQRKTGVTSTKPGSETIEEMDPRMLRALGEQHMQRNEHDKAARRFKQLAEIMPEDLESRARLAEIYSRQDQHDAALSEWQALLKVDPDNTKYQDGLVNAYRLAGKTDEAIKLAEKYIADEENSIHYARLAKVYASGNHIDEAIATYQRAIDLNPGDANIHQELAQMYLRKEDFEAAEKSFREALRNTGEEWERRNIERQIIALYRQQGKLDEKLEQAESEGLLTFEMQKERAQTFVSQGELEKAVEAYEKALNMSAQSWEKNDLSRELTAVYARLGQTEATIELYEMLSQSGSHGGVSFGMGSTEPFSYRIHIGNDQVREYIIDGYKSIGKLDELLEYLIRRRENEGDEPIMLEIIAAIHHSRGDYAETAATYRQLCEAQPGNVRSFFCAAAALNKDGQPELARKMLVRGEAIRSTSQMWNQDMWRLLSLAGICLEGELYDTAVELLKSAMSNQRQFGGSFEHQMIHQMFALAYLGMERYSEAVEAYQRMENSAADDHTKRIAREGIRRAYREGNLADQFIAEQRKTIENSPDDPDAHFALAQSYELNGMLEKAIAAYERAKALNPDSSIILDPLAKLYIDADPDKAKLLYKRLIALADSADVRREYRNVLIDLYKRHGEFDAAISELLDTVQSTEDEVERNAALPLLWGIYTTEDRAAEGLATLEALVTKLANNSTLYEVLGDAYKETGDLEKANTAYTRWIELSQRELERQEHHWGYMILVPKLLIKGILPEKTLELAKRAPEAEPNPYYYAILGAAYLMNGLYDEAESSLKSALGSNEIINMPSQWLWSILSPAARAAKDTSQLTNLVEALIEDMPVNAAGRVHASLLLATFHHEHNRPEEAERYMRRSGIVPESAWWTIGPFDNTRATEDHMPEETTKVDPTRIYQGKSQQVSWKQVADGTPDGLVNLAEIFGFGGFTGLIDALFINQARVELDGLVGYASVVVKSPDERKVRICFSSLNNATIWFNGEEVFTSDQDQNPVITQYHPIPVTLNPGENSIRVKLGGRQWGWGFHLWLTDMDGKPFGDLVFPEERDVN